MMQTPGIYLHIPFCLKKCHYCSFCSYPVSPDSPQVHDYVQALMLEMERTARQWGGKVRTVYIGGGTPSILPEKLLGALLDKAGALFFDVAEGECTLEVNPGTLSPGKLKTITGSLINRISLGVQSANDELLARIGRIHTWKDARMAYDACRDAGLDNISVDLIYGLPGQDRADWRRTLSQVVALEPDHVSAYSLQVEEGTELERRLQKRIWTLPDENEEDEMFSATQKGLSEGGLMQYEISSYCRGGRESRHNRIYWHNEPYLGLGAAAFSYTDRVRSSNSYDPDIYIQRIRRGQSPAVWKETLSPEAEMEETMMMTLRMTQGFSLQWFEERFSVDARIIFAKPLENLQKQGLIHQENGRIMPTDRGLRFNNRVGREFLGSLG